jgi:hypothetical protein
MLGAALWDVADVGAVVIVSDVDFKGLNKIFFFQVPARQTITTPAIGFGVHNATVPRCVGAR